jgi:hypothetical protein
MKRHNISNLQLKLISNGIFAVACLKSKHFRDATSLNFSIEKKE